MFSSTYVFSRFKIFMCLVVNLIISSRIFFFCVIVATKCKFIFDKCCTIFVTRNCGLISLVLLNIYRPVSLNDHLAECFRKQSKSFCKCHCRNGLAIFVVFGRTFFGFRILRKHGKIISVLIATTIFYSFVRFDAM